MKLIKLTALPIIILSSLIVLNSCESDAEMKKTTDFQKVGIVMSGSQETPPNASTAIGKLDVFYTRETRTLTYTVLWSGLSDSVKSMTIQGLAPIGYASPTIVQNIVASSGGVYAQKTSGKFTYGKSGSLTGTLLVDGVVIKENDLINGQYYINIVPNSPAAYAGGEIRGQIVFQ
jgi:hypothetical protein